MNTQYKNKNLTHYDADFYRWTKATLNTSERNLWIQDIDSLIRDRDDNLMLLEIKRRGYDPKGYQRRNMLILDELIKAGLDALASNVTISINGYQECHQVSYHGFNLLQLSGDSFFDSSFYFNGQDISSDRLADLLSFGRSNT
jgi:hypothetical protein